MNYIISFLILSFTSFDSRPKNYSLLIEKIDNRVEVLLGDSIIYNSGVIDFNPELDFRLNLDSYKVESNKLTIRLFNGSPGRSSDSDPHWELRYLLYKGDEVVEYEWQQEDDYQTGMVFEVTYELL